MLKLSQFILITVVISFLWGCATTPPISSHSKEDCSDEQTLAVSETNCDCEDNEDNDETVLQLTKENHTLKRRLDEANFQLDEFVAKKETHQKSLDELKTQLKATQEKLERLTAQNGKLKNQVAKLTQKAKKNQAKIKTLQIDRTKLTNQVKRLEQQLNDTKKPSVESNSPQQDDNSSGNIYEFKKNE